MKNNEKSIYIDFCHNGEFIPLGILFVDNQKGRDIYSFQYAKEYLASKYKNLFLDVNLMPYSERQYLPIDSKFFSFISDAMPDRWGRMLLDRKEIINSNKNNEKPRKLLEADYLLGVSDYTRMGALRFKLDENGPYLGDDEKSVPPFEKLRDLEYASYEYEKDELSLKDDWIKLLLAPGSSLGGARPKANVEDIDKSLWIAKFPSKHDIYDMGAWEMISNDLASLCGIEVAEHRLLKLSDRGSIFLSKRFDRNNGNRIAFISAMTALGKSDNSTDGTSYLDIVSFIKAYSNKANDDLKELYRRIAFNIAISNSDDHLRNHGFILKDGYWNLSPAYDLNPIVYGNHLSLLIDSSSDEMSFDILLSISKHFNMSNEEGLSIINNIKNVVKNNYEKLALKYNISNSSISYMRNAFKKAE